MHLKATPYTFWTTQKAGRDNVSFALIGQGSNNKAKRYIKEERGNGLSGQKAFQVACRGLETKGALRVLLVPIGSYGRHLAAREGTGYTSARVVSRLVEEEKARKMSTIPTPIEVFYSYADADEPLRHEMEKHLSLLRREGLIATWHKRQIIAGTDWAETLDRHLNTASVILLLISANFVASDYCYGREMQRAMQRHYANEARVIPILLRSVDWQSAPFGKLKALPSDGTPITLWRNRDAAFTDVAQGIRAVLRDVQRLTVSTPPTAFPRIWNIPYPHNWMFTGCEEVLTRLATLLQAGQPTALSQPQAISGLGGIGKTQIVVEYAYRHAQHYQAVLWTRADTSEALISGYNAIAGLLNLPEKGEQDQMITVQAVLRWLTTHTEWLLILDNADDLAIVHEFLPSVFGGHILLTTRAQAMGRLAKRIEVDIMEQNVGALFLLRRASLIDLDAPLEHATAADIAIAGEISKELGGLPLALDQAGAYLEETGCSLSQYLQFYRTRRAVLLQRRGRLMTDHPEPVATTWSLSFEQVEQQSPAAADLLRLCAFLHPDAIPEEIITNGAAYLGPHLSPVAEDPLVLDEAMTALGAYSLIRRDVRDSMLSIHQLVQAVLRDSMNETVQDDWTQRVVRAVYAAFPVVDFTTWSQCERCLPHALVCAELIEQRNLTLSEAASLLSTAGEYLHARARYSEAEPLLERVLAICEQQLGAKHPGTVGSLNNLAALYYSQGKYKQAEPLYERALTICEQQLGAEHPDIASSLNGIAAIYYSQRKFEQAEPFVQRALAIQEQQLGVEHPDTANSLNNLAELYQEQGKYEQAEPLLQRALQIDEKAFGPEHPCVATDLNNLALLYDYQGKYELAETVYQRALSISKSVLGLHHPQTSTVRENYTSFLRAMGREADAVQEEMRDQGDTPLS
jgi:tetratricopeptide (TPR) repeat protein